MHDFARVLKIDQGSTFFLWGPRQSGKSTLLRTLFPNSPCLDLLKSDEFSSFATKPSRLREVTGELKPGAFFVIDEIQKVPALLDEVHWIIENKKLRFGLCGSSARKLRRGHANLLGGRALRYELFGFVSQELGENFIVDRIINNGYLPRIYLSENPTPLLHSYVSDYLREEIAAEGLIRNLPSFSDFLRVASLCDTEIVNFSSIASDCGISPTAARSYYEILEDTLLGRYLPAYTKKQKRRVKHRPKFYLADVGVVNFLAKRGHMKRGSPLYGKAFENWVFHELSAYLSYRSIYEELSYWSLSSQSEVDFIVGDMQLALEAKASENIDNRRLKGLRELAKEGNRVKKRVIISLESRVRVTEDNILILPAEEFATRLWSGELFAGLS